MGALSLSNNMTGQFNTAVGVNALFSNNGDNNTAVGSNTLENTTGQFNTAIGGGALFNDTSGNNNIAVGLDAGMNLDTGDNNIDIGNFNTSTFVSSDVAGESNTIRIGYEGQHTATFIAGINGATVSGTAVMIDASTGQLGTVVSSQRFKDAIKPMDKASEAILSLRPVTFRYKHALDAKGIPQFGLVAEEVEKVNPDLVVRDAGGKAYSVRYEAVNAMLLNEFLKEHEKVEQQGETIAELQSTITTLATAIKTQAAAIQKVNDKVELNQPTLRAVATENSGR